MASSFRTRWLLVLACTLAHAPALAQSAADKETARSLMDQGDGAMRSKDYEAALKAYKAADDIMHVPTTGLAVAKARLALGRLVEARDAALAVTRLPVAPNEPEALAEARAEAADLANSIAARIPSLTVTVEGGPGSGVVVLLDGASIRPGIPRKLDPGEHVVVAKAPGFVEARSELEIAESAEERVTLKLTPAAAASPSGVPSTPPEQDVPAPGGTSPLVYVGFGVGAAGIVVGSVTGILSLSKTSSVKDQCDGNRCPTSAEGDADSAKTLANVSNIGFGVGIIGIGLGIYGLVSSGSSGSESVARRRSLEPVVGARFVGLRGALP